MGKGDTPRPVDPQKYADGWERTFRRKDGLSSANTDLEFRSLDDVTRSAEEELGRIRDALRGVARRRVMERVRLNVETSRDLRLHAKRTGPHTWGTEE